MDKPKLALKSVKISNFASHETYCFEATLWVDGKSFCKTGNDGQGGPNWYSEDWEKIQPLNDRVKATFEKWEGFKGRMIETNLEMAVSNLVTDFLMRRDLKRMLKNKTVTLEVDAKDPKVKAVWTYKKPKGQVNQERQYELLMEKYNVEEILNMIDFEKALEIYKEWC